MSKLLISACLLGQKVRYNGEGKLVDHPHIQQLKQQQRLVTICPEVAGGLGVPRPPAQIQGQNTGAGVLQGIAWVKTDTGLDVTEQFILGAQKTLQLAQAHDVKVALLKARSPSCGSRQVYDGTFSGKQFVDGMGVTAALLSQHGIRVFNEEEIDAALLALESF